MPKHYDSMYIECPFFHYYDGSKIACEGVVDDSSIHVVFPNPELRRNYMKSICYCEHDSCIVAKALYNYKYSDTKE